MRRYTAMITLVFAAAAVQAETIKKTYEFSPPRIHAAGGYQTISLPGTVQKGIPGEPLLPYQSVLLVLPPGEEVVSISVTGEGLRTFSGVFTLAPAQPARRFSDQDPGTFMLNKAVYAGDALYTAGNGTAFSTGYMNGVPVALSAFTPVQYNPARGSLAWYSRMTVTIETGPAPVPARLPAELSPLRRHRLTLAAQNAADLDMYPDRVSDAGDYEVLVITGDDYTDAFSELLSRYARRGLRGQVAGLGDIEAEAQGDDRQERIRNFIIQEYTAHGIEHVLLAGDEEIIPSRRFYCYVQSGSGVSSSSIPADIYYSALDGSWNTDGDGLWAEIGEDDLLPDVSVGRLPFSTATDLERMLHKLFMYQSQPVSGELRDPLLVGEKAWDDPLSWGADYLELLVGTRSDNGYTTTGIPEDHDISTLYDRQDGTWSAGLLIDEISRGHSYLYHSGHSNYNFNMRLSTYDIREENFAAIDGVTHNYLNIYSHGCNSGGFDANDCIGERMLTLEHFAVSYIGNSRFGWFNEGQTEGPSLHLNREFVSALYGDHITTIGEAHLLSKVRSAPWVNAPNQHEDGALRWCFYACNVLGDPAMPVWTDEPMAIDNEYLVSLDEAQGLAQLQLLSSGRPLEGYTCAIVQDSTLLATAVTDGSGMALLQLTPAAMDSAGTRLFVSGYNRPPLLLPLIEAPPEPLPERPALAGNYPNPFNLTTTIRYRLPAEAQVSISIYNIRGQLVTTLLDGRAGQGTQTVVWDGRDSSGRKVESGLYIVYMESGGSRNAHKVMLVK
ncbi:T9SS type A sorting domain-containing protein [bacterium]|nr:T9SS type A sorting domain-containing protein [bacterium]